MSRAEAIPVLAQGERFSPYRLAEYLRKMPDLTIQEKALACSLIDHAYQGVCENVALSTIARETGRSLRTIQLWLHNLVEKLARKFPETLGLIVDRRRGLRNRYTFARDLLEKAKAIVIQKLRSAVKTLQTYAGPALPPRRVAVPVVPAHVRDAEAKDFLENLRSVGERLGLRRPPS